jgi:hypothetical protein
MIIYIVIGTTEDVYQERIDEDFTPHYNKEVVEAFTNEEDAQKLIERSRLAKPKRTSYSGTSYYKGGYYEMGIETTSLNADVE